MFGMSLFTICAIVVLFLSLAFGRESFVLKLYGLFFMIWCFLQMGNDEQTEGRSLAEMGPILSCEHPDFEVTPDAQEGMRKALERTMESLKNRR